MFLFSHYSYSYIKNRLEEHYHQKVSLPTVIERAKQHGFYWKKPRRTVHDKEVSTNYAGELIQLPLATPFGVAGQAPLGTTRKGEAPALR